MLLKKDELFFDPLKRNSPQRHVVKAFAVYMAAIILSIALCESVSQDGVYINI